MLTNKWINFSLINNDYTINYNIFYNYRINVSIVITLNIILFVLLCNEIFLLITLILLHW